MMSVRVYLVCAALVVAVKGDEATNFYGRQLEPADLNPEQDTFRYIFPRLTSSYRTSKNWNDNRYYDLPDFQTDFEELALAQEGRTKRANFNGNGVKQFVDGPSLSIVNPLDVLRNRLLLAISRKKAMEGANRNRNLLCRIGKRSQFYDNKPCPDDGAKSFLP